jgi:single-stranded DNA-binding protein
MSDLNKVIVSGVIAEPKLGYLESGKPELRLNLTVEQDGGFRLYVSVYCYGARAEPLAESLEAGDRVLIDGKLSWRSTVKAGVKESKMVVTCYGVEVLTSAGVPQETRSESGEGVDTSADMFDAPEADPAPKPRKRAYPQAAKLGGFAIR